MQTTARQLFCPQLASLIMLLFSFGTLNAQGQMKEIVITENAPAPIGPYSQAVKAGGMMFISGQIAIEPSTGTFKSGLTIAEETRRVMENIKSIVEAAGYSMDQVVKSTIYLKDMSLFSEMNAVYGEYFKSDPPARETVAVVGLPKGAQVEISVIVIIS